MMAAQQIQSAFADGVHVEIIKDACATGNFEVTVDGQLVHSKATRGEGFVADNATAMDMILDAIDDALAAKQ